MQGKNTSFDTSTAVFANYIKTEVKVRFKGFPLHWPYIKCMSKYLRTEYMLIIRRIPVDSRCSNEFNNGDFLRGMHA